MLSKKTTLKDNLNLIVYTKGQPTVKHTNVSGFSIFSEGEYKDIWFIEKGVTTRYEIEEKRYVDILDAREFRKQIGFIYGSEWSLHSGAYSNIANDYIVRIEYFANDGNIKFETDFLTVTNLKNIVIVPSLYSLKITGYYRDLEGICSFTIPKLVDYTVSYE